MKLKRLATIILSVLSPTAFAEISTDGTVGPAQTLGANNGQFTIGQDLGSLKGSNLFHSFKQFNINTGESATFTGSNAIKNVISRVTGGNESVINGLLQSKIGSADFYFINPAGIVFGENAQVDVPSAFHMSTAAELKFADGASFNALNPEASTLTVAAPEGFGFAKGQNASLKILGGRLVFKPGTDVSLSANNIEISGIEQDNGETIPAGILVQQADPTVDKGIHLNLTTVDPETAQIISGITDNATGGNLLIENSVINTSGNGFGLLSISSGNIKAQNSLLASNNTGMQSMNNSEGTNLHTNSLLLDNSSLTNHALNKGDAGTALVTVNDEMQVLKGGNVSSIATSAGNAGSITVNAGQLTIDGKEESDAVTGIYSSSFLDTGTSKAGAISVTVNRAMNLKSGGQVSSFTSSDGGAGNVSVKAEQLTIDGQDSKITTGIFSNTSSETDKAGIVSVDIKDTMQLLNGGLVSSSTFAKGDASSIIVEAGDLVIDRQGNKNFTGIGSQANSGEGNAGTVFITVHDTMQIFNGGLVTSSTFSKGDAGSVTIDAGQLIIDRQGSNIPTGIASDAEQESSGNAGSVLITVQDTMLVLGGSVSSSTTSQGNAGSVTVNTKQLTIDNMGSEDFSGISSSSLQGSVNSETNISERGNAGIVSVKVNDVMQILNGGKVRSSTFTEGDAGSVTVDAGELTIDRQGGILSNTASSGNAGTVLVTVDNSLKILNGGQIGSATFNSGDAGSITIDTNELLIGGSDNADATGIFSTAEQKSTGKAGTLLITVTDTMQVLNSGQLSSSTFAKGDAGNVNVEAGRLIIDDQGSSFLTGIISQANSDSAGKAGTVSVKVKDTLLLLNGGQLSSSTFAKGDAGNVNVEAGQLTIDGLDGLGTKTFTGIASLASPESTGKVGSVNISATSQIVLLNGVISIAAKNNSLQPSTATEQNPTPAKITINTPTLRLEQNSEIEADAMGEINSAPIEINVTDNLDLLNSQITTSAFNGDGGFITINAGNHVSLKNSQVTTSVLGELNGNGGDISLTAPILLMDTGFIQANTAALLDDGGDINLNIRQLVASGDSLLQGTTEPLFFDSNRVNYNVIQATSEFGINGNINITSPELNIVGALAGVNIPELDIGRMGKDPCASSLENTLKSLGHGGVPAFQNGENYLPINRFGKPKNKLEKLNTSSAHTSIKQASHRDISIECSKT